MCDLKDRKLKKINKFIILNFNRLIEIFFKIIKTTFIKKKNLRDNLKYN